MMKKIIAAAAAVTILFSFAYQSAAFELPMAQVNTDCVSAILMDAKTGTVLFEQNADEPLPPASVTKVMTLLLVMEAIDNGIITLDSEIATSEHAASMGGSQIYLEPGEVMKASDLIKSVVISSANDAAVALAEAVAGSEEAFVTRMNERAAELGCKNTHFENTNGLDDTTQNHVMSARDIALISRELLKYPKIIEYASTWMDSVRDGAFGLTNTNRLVRFYRGATGLKTGSTSKARFCVSATAQRGNMHLIAVVMASPTRDTRNATAMKLLDSGFANYALFQKDETDMGTVPVTGGISNTCAVKQREFAIIVPKAKESAVAEASEMKESVAAPVSAGDVVGTVTYTLDGEVIGTADIVAAEDVAKISFAGVLGRLFKAFLPG